MTQKDSFNFERGSKAGFIALGVVYGDIGTSHFIPCKLLLEAKENWGCE